MSTSSDTMQVDVECDMDGVFHPILRRDSKVSANTKTNGDRGEDVSDGEEGLEMSMNKMTLHCNGAQAPSSHQNGSNRDIKTDFGARARAEGMGYITEEKKKDIINMANSMEKMIFEVIDGPTDSSIPLPCQIITQSAKNFYKECFKRFKANGKDFSYEEALMFTQETDIWVEYVPLENLMLKKCEKLGGLAWNFRRHPTIQVQKDMRKIMLQVLGPLIAYIEGMMRMLSSRDPLPAELRTAIHDLAVSIRCFHIYTMEGAHYNSEMVIPIRSLNQMQQLWSELPKDQYDYLRYNPDRKLLNQDIGKPMKPRNNYNKNQESADIVNLIRKYTTEWGLDDWDDHVLYWNMVILTQRLGLTKELGISMLHAFNNDVNFTRKYLEERNLIK